MRIGVGNFLPLLDNVILNFKTNAKLPNLMLETLIKLENICLPTFVVICSFRYRRPSLFTVLTIHIKFKWNLTPVLCSKPGLAIRSFTIHIQIFLERNPRELRGKPVKHFWKLNPFAEENFFRLLSKRSCLLLTEELQYD